jgi:hypothetical protein
MSGCLICGADLPPQDNGRPRRYCSTGCKRASEYERRRLQAQLDVLERYQRNLRVMGTERRQQQRIQEEIRQAQARLVALLAG